MLKSYRHISSFIILLFSFWAGAQDLIPNASFERCNLCPTKLGSFDEDVIHWSAPTLGSTDYFNSCSKSMGTPENFNGKQAAQSGTSYAGFYLYAPEDYREYVQTRLSRTLKKNQEYLLTFYISRAERSDFAIQEVGILLGDRELDVDTKKTLTKKHWFASEIRDYNYLEIKTQNFWEQTRQWVKLETKFKAKGTEQYIIVGNFKPNARTRVHQTTRGAKKGAYYYIDNFSLKAIENETEVNDENMITSTAPLELNKKHRFQNVLFEFDRFVLLDTAKSDIQKVYNYLRNNADLFIHIDGHTDNVGSPGYNRRLSGRRCEAVAQYLLGLGLAEDRISWQAHGGTSPISENDTDQGRKLNRRVEFILKQDEKLNEIQR
ncbi:MAG: OmpA family protein [Flavobacteriaceae bacterium]